MPWRRHLFLLQTGRLSGPRPRWWRPWASWHWPGSASYRPWGLPADTLIWCHSTHFWRGGEKAQRVKKISNDWRHWIHLESVFMKSRCLRWVIEKCSESLQQCNLAAVKWNLPPRSLFSKHGQHFSVEGGGIFKTYSLCDPVGEHMGNLSRGNMRRR